MATPLTSFIKQVMPHVSGCPEAIVIDATREAAVKFCTHTQIIREKIPPIDVLAGTDEYNIVASSEKEVVGIVSFLYNNRELHQKTEEELDIIDCGWRTAEPGVATYVAVPEPGRFILNRIPIEDIPGSIVIKAATKPAGNAENLDDALHSNWIEAIKYGSLESLFEIPGKGWSDMNQALWYGKRFNYLIQSGKARARMGHLTNKTTVAQLRAWV